MTSAVSTYLGYGPVLQPLLLITGTTFVQSITPSAGAVFATGTTVVLNLTTAMGAPLAGSPWNGTVTPTLVSWSVSNTIADPVPANSRYEIIVTYPTAPTVTYCWFAGPVLRNPI